MPKSPKKVLRLLGLSETGGYTMNRFLILVSFLLLISAIPLRANTTTDPNIGMDDPPCDIELGCPVPNPTPISGALGTSFTFNADGSGGGITFFRVDPSGPGFSTLDIETPVGYVPDSVNCTSSTAPTGTPPFNSCTVRNLDGVTDIYFSNIVLLTALLTTTDPGLPAGDEFAINLNLNALTCNPFNTDCSSTGDQGWGAGEAFTAFPNVPKPINPLIPEPSTGSLLALGVLGLLAAKNKKKFGEVLRSL